MKNKKSHIINITIMYAAMFLGFFNTFFKAKVFSPEEIGVLSTILSISLIVNVLIIFGSNSAILKYYVEVKEDGRRKSAFLLFSSLLPFVILNIACVIFIVLKDQILGLYHESLLNDYYDYILILFVFNFITTNMDMIFRSEYLSEISNLINNFLTKLLSSIFLIFIYLVMNNGFKYFFVFTVLLPVLQSIVFFVIYKYKVPLNKPKFDKITSDYIKEYYTFSSFMFLSQASGRFIEWIDKLIIGSLLSMSWVGIYTIALSFVNLTKLLSRAINLSAGQLVSQAWYKNDIAQLKKSYKELTNLPLSLGLLILLFLVGWGKSLLLFFGADYIKGYWTMIILSIGALVNLGTSVSGNILKFSRKFKYDLLIQVVLLVLAVVTNYLFIPFWGITGAALATSLSLSIYNFLKLFLVYKFFKLQPYTMETVKIFLHFCFFLIIILFVIPDNLKQLTLLNLIYVITSLTLIYIFTGAYILRISVLKNSILEIIRRFKHNES